MLDLNQRPPPCKRQNHMLWVFTAVSEYLQIPAFPFYGRSACSLLFRCVVVKLSSTSIERRDNSIMSPLPSLSTQSSKTLEVLGRKKRSVIQSKSTWSRLRLWPSSYRYTPLQTRAPSRPLNFTPRM